MRWKGLELKRSFPGSFDTLHHSTRVTVSFVVHFPKRISDQARKLENWNQTWENTCQKPSEVARNHL